MTHGTTKDSTVIRCWPADGDRVKFFPPNESGVATVSIAYSLGADFNSCPVQERAKRTKGLINLVATATNEVMEEILDEFNASKHPGEESIKRKHGKQSPFVQGGLPSLGKRR